MFMLLDMVQYVEGKCTSQWEYLEALVERDNFYLRIHYLDGDKGFYHKKVCIVDKRAAVIGSDNPSNAAFGLSRDASVWCRTKEPLLPCIEQCDYDWLSKRSFEVSRADVIRDARSSEKERREYWYPRARQFLSSFRCGPEGLIVNEARASGSPTPGVSTGARDYCGIGSPKVSAPYHPLAASSPGKKVPVPSRSPPPGPRGSYASAAAPGPGDGIAPSTRAPASLIPPMPFRPPPE